MRCRRSAGYSPHRGGLAPRFYGPRPGRVPVTLPEGTGYGALLFTIPVFVLQVTVVMRTAPLLRPRRGAAALGLALALHLLGAAPASAWWNQNWTKRVKLTFLNGGQPENLMSFPVLVRLDGSRISYADTRNAGEDVRFVDADDTTLLAHEIESWDEAGSSFVWVKAPQVDASSNADFIYMYYGNPLAPDAQSPTVVWGDGFFEMVQHLSETAGTHFDSTSKNNDSIAVDVTTQGSSTGRIDGADVFAGTNSIDVADAATLDMGASDSFTLEAWVKTSNAGQQMIVSKEVPAGGQYQLWTDAGNAKFWLHDGTLQAHAQSATSVANDQWRYVVGRFTDGPGTAEVFVDGTSVVSTSTPGLGSLATARPLRIGEEGDSDPEGGFNFAGTIDEVRLSRTARSNNWIRAQYLSMADAFLSFGAPSPSGVMRVKSGSYAGSGSDDRAIYVGFQPDVVIVDMDDTVTVAPDEAVIRTSTMASDFSKDMDGPNLPAADKIQSLTATGFTVGTHATVNEAGRTYHWVAFQAAPGKLKLGSYPGDGVTDARSIVGVGFQPEYVMLMSGGTHQAVQRSSVMPGDLTHQFDSMGFADGIEALEVDGFRVGLDPRVNAASTTYYYAAWNLSPGEFAVGVYTGNGATLRDITGVGFFPEYVHVTRSGSAFPSTHKPASTGVGLDRSLLFESRLGDPDNIQALQADGFQVGGHSRVNSSTAPNDYYWAAFGPHSTKTNLRSIGDTAINYGTGPGATSGNGTTVSVVNGSNSVTGLGGTTWLTPSNRGRGDVITIPCGNPPTCTGGVHYTIGQVTSQTSLQLTEGYQGATNASVSYLIRRQFLSPAAWEDCIDGGGTSCNLFPSVSSTSLVADDRNEVGIVYEDLVYTGPLNGILLRFLGATTDAQHAITLTADGANRHYGISGNGVRFQLAATSSSGDLIEIMTRFVTVEWIEFVGDRAGADAIEVTDVAAAGKVIVRNNLIQNVGVGVQPSDALADVDVYNNIIYRTSKEGIGILQPLTARIFNNTIYDVSQEGIYANPSGSIACAPSCTFPGVLLRNNLVHTTANPNYSVPGLNPASSHNLSGPADVTATSHSPAGGGQPAVSLAAVAFVDPLPASKDLHLLGTSFAIDKAADLSGVFGLDIDSGARVTLWDIGADDVAATTPTRVDLVSFEASGSNGAVTLRWETATELDNLGFHVYRASSETGPYARMTTRLIPGLGSSPEGARYQYVDSGLENGTTYFYKLEDVETTGTTELHGPVSATPSSATDPPATNLIVYGRPEANAFRILTRSSDEIVLELTTEGFTAEPREDGSVLLEIPGFSPLSVSPSLPVLRPWVEVPSGRGARIASVETSSVESFTGLRPSGAEAVEVVASPRGTVRARRASARRHEQTPDLVPAELARLLQVGFQGGAKKVQLEIAPLRWNGASRELLLARKLTVHLALQGRVVERGSRRPRARGVVARLVTTENGLHEVRYEDLFGKGRGRGIESLRLSRQGEAVAFHLEPAGKRFGPGSRLYFWSEGPSANPYGSELVYELEIASGGREMRLGSAAPSGEPLGSHLATTSYEENRYYQAALLDADDLWLWDVLLAPVTKSFPFQLNHVAAGDARLTVWLQGVSDFASESDHHVRLYVNGAFQGEADWDGKKAENVALQIPEGVFREGENRLEIENVGDTGAQYSMVMLDRFELVYPRLSIASGGQIEGLWTQGATALVTGLGPAHVLDMTEADPRWLSGARISGDGTLGFRVEEGRRYVAVSRQEVARPVVRTVARPRLEMESLRADYLVIGPSEFSSVAAPLLEHRRRQGLTVKFAATEDIFSEFGFGEARPEAIRDFIDYAYHQWREPKLRYVLLLGDATYDFKDYLRTGVRNQVPPLLVKTSFLWTASDPTLAAIHGEDLLPDVAIGRLPAADVQELLVMVAKILAYETGEADLAGSLLLVTDNSDRAGDFEAHAEEIARGVLAGRDVRHLSIAELGGATRGELVSALDEGASLLSYIGHGGIHLWADENVFNVADVPSLSPQAQQPLLLTMNCLNGYFHFPYFDSLAEALLKTEGKGAVAAFSPSGLSLDGPAHRYHLELLDAVLNQGHGRLGDAVLAAQSAYAESGAFPELIAIYHLLGDPALSLR